MMARKSEKTRAAEWLEWAIATVSAAAILAIGGYLVREGLSDTTEPALSVAAGPAADGALHFVVRNDGGRTANAVALSLILRRDGAVVGERRLVVDYVPADSEAEGAFLLPQSEGVETEIVVEGYLAP